MVEKPIREFEVKSVLFPQRAKRLDKIIYAMFVSVLTLVLIVSLPVLAWLLISEVTSALQKGFLALLLLIIVWLIYLVFSRLLPAIFGRLKMRAVISDTCIRIGEMDIAWKTLKGYRLEGNRLYLYSKSKFMGTPPPTIPMPAYKAFELREGVYVYDLVCPPGEIEGIISKFLPKLGKESPEMK